jgi:hypothetical protein
MTNTTFASKAEQKRALEALSKAFEKQREDVAYFYLSIDRELRTEREENVYWELPHNLHQWRPKHAELVLSVFPQAETQVYIINALATTRKAVADTPIVPPAKETKVYNWELINKEARDIIHAQAKGQALRWIENARQYPPTSASYKNLVRPCLSGGEFIQAKADKLATTHADNVVTEIVGKLTIKCGELTNVSVSLHNGGSGFRIEGQHNGHFVDIYQEQIVNVSIKGKLFNQYPSRIYVDGKFTPAADYSKEVQ